MSDVFISYTQHDFQIVREIAAALESVDISTWYFSRDQLPGAKYVTRIQQTIKESGCMLLVVSPATLQRSSQVDREVFCAGENSKRIIPILVGVSFETFSSFKDGDWQFQSGATVCLEVDPQELSMALPRLCRGIMAVLKEDTGREFPDYLYKRLDGAETEKIDLSAPIDGVDIEFDPLSLPEVDEQAEAADDDMVTIELGVENESQTIRSSQANGDVRAAPDALSFDVFISAKSDDAELAIKTYEYLTSKGLGVFYSHFTLPRLGSTRYREVIDSAIEACNHFVMVASSRQNLESGWVKAELDIFLCELRAGRKSGNLCTVVSGDLTIEQLPISLRNQEVFELNDASLERLCQFLSKPVDRVVEPRAVPTQVRETPTIAESDSVESAATIPHQVNHSAATQQPITVGHAAPDVQPVTQVRTPPVSVADRTAAESPPNVVQAVKVDQPAASRAPEPVRRKAKYEIREVLDTLNGLAVLLTESADYHADQMVRQQLEDCGLFAYRVRTKLMARPNRYASLSEQDESRVESVADHLRELIAWWQSAYGSDPKRILWREDSLTRWASSLRGKTGFCNLIDGTIKKTRGS